MKKWESFLPHLSFCMLLCLLVFMILDGYNPFMYWLTRYLYPCFDIQRKNGKNSGTSINLHN